jgi:hypothetical protein
MKPTQSPLTLEKDRARVQQDRVIKTTPALQSALLFTICAAAVGSAGYYAGTYKKNNLQSSQCVQPANLDQVKPKTEEPAIGHIFWESVTRLIISVKK